MPHIVLSEDQAKVVAAAVEPVRVCDGHGNVLSSITPIWTDEEIADAKRRLASNEPRYSTRQVIDYLRGLGRK